MDTKPPSIVMSLPNSQYLGLTYSDLLLEQSRWETPLDSLSTEICTMVEKFSEMIDEEVGTNKENTDEKGKELRYRELIRIF